MPSFDTTIEDYSPLLTYSLDWTQGTGEGDSLVSRYSGSSFFATKTTGGAVTFTFSGTGIEVFGAKRLNHGNYVVTLDGTSFPTFSGTAPDPGTFQSSLFSRFNLNGGSHDITLSNQGTNSQFLDIDFVNLRTSVGLIDERLIMNTIQDNDPAFAYTGSWFTTPDNLGTFAGGSGHFTSEGSMTLTFQTKPLAGDAVSLYGPVGPKYGSYVVQVDGGAVSRTLSATKVTFVPKVLMYHGSNFGPGKHTLKLICRPAPGQACAVDYAEVFTTPSLQKASGEVTAGSGSLPGGAIAGIVICVILFVAGGLFGLWWFLRRRRRQRQLEKNRDFVIDRQPSFRAAPPVTTNYTPDFIATDPFTTVTSPSAGSTTLSYNPPTDTSDARSQYSTMTRSSSRHLIKSSPNSVISDEETSSAGPSSRPRMPLTIANSTSPRPLLASLKAQQQAVVLPAAAGESFEGISEEELRSRRLVVEGRPQDFGSLSNREDIDGAGPSGSSSPGVQSPSVPPPDYSQATQPFR